MTEAPRRFGNFELLRRLGGDEKHEVFVARKGGDEHIVSFVDLGEEALAEIASEIESCRTLRHPAIVPVTALEEHDGKTALIHPAVNGRTLASVAVGLRGDGERLSDLAVWYIGSQLASALAATHRLKHQPPLVHGGLSPEHVVLTWDGQVRLVGVGASAAFSRVPPKPWTRMAAPEVRAGGPVTPEANCYSVAAIVWWLLSDALPPDKPPSLASTRPEAPKMVLRAIDRALATAPRERGSCAVMAGALSRHHEGGRAEIVWNMEIFRALDVQDDDLPASHAFPSSRPPRSSHPTQLLPPKAVLEEVSLPPSVRKKEAAKAVARRTTLQSSRDDLLGSTAADPVPISVELARDASASDPRSLLSDDDGPGMFDVGGHSSAPPVSDRTEQIAFDELERRAEADARMHERAKRQQIFHALHLLEQEEKRRKAAPMFPEPDSTMGPRSDEDITREVGVSELEDRVVAAKVGTSSGTVSEGAEGTDEGTPSPSVEAPASSEVPTSPEAAQAAEPAAPTPRDEASASRPGASMAEVPIHPSPVAPAPHVHAAPIHAAPPAPHVHAAPLHAAPVAAAAIPPAPEPAARRAQPARVKRRSLSTILLTITVAVVAAGAFAGGVLLTARLTADGDDAPAPQPTLSASVPTAPPPSTQVATAPSPVHPPAAPSGPVEKPTNRAAPADGMGFLRVKAPVPDAGVYVQGHHVGNVGEPIELPCRMVFVRLGRVPLTAWFNRGRAVSVECGTETVVEMDIEPSPE